MAKHPSTVLRKRKELLVLPRNRKKDKHCQDFLLRDLGTARTQDEGLDHQVRGAPRFVKLFTPSNIQDAVRSTHIRRRHVAVGTVYPTAIL